MECRIVWESKQNRGLMRASDTKRILIVDDDDAIRATFRYTFVGGRWEVDTAESGTEALERIEDQPYDLIFLDYRMPEMTGLEVMNALRKRAIDIPVVLVSAHLSRYSVQRVKEAYGVAEVVSKPVSPDQLRTIAERNFRAP